MAKIYWTAKEYTTVFKRMEEHLKLHKFFPTSTDQFSYNQLMRDLPAERRRPVSSQFVNALIDACNLWRVNPEIEYWAPNKGLLNEPDPRTIRTVYYSDIRAKKVLKTNRAKYVNRAVLHCVDHMQMNTYAARLAEVIDGFTGETHATVEHTLIGDIKIVFKREGKETNNN